jgi:hypothetical protein
MESDMETTIALAKTTDPAPRWCIATAPKKAPKPADSAEALKFFAPQDGRGP